MPTYTARKELLAPLEDVWLFLAEPHHLSDWWPGVAAVTPDRRGLAPAARWKLHAPMRPSLLRRPASESTLQIIEVEPPMRVTWYMTAERLDVEIRLEDAGNHHTNVELTVTGPFMVGLRRSFPKRRSTASTPCARLPQSSEMFDLRYHVASLAAVFLALIIGILVGVGISDRGLVDSAKSKFLQDEVASLQRRLDNKATQSTDQARERAAAQSFMKKTYPALARNRLKGKQIAVVFVGSVDSGIQSTVGRAITDAGAQQVRMRALKVPIDSQQLDAALKGQPAAAGLRGKSNLESLGRELGQELVLGGDTPLWNPLSDLVEEQARRQQDSGGRRGRRSHGRTAAGRDDEVPARPVRRARVGRRAGGRSRADRRRRLGDPGLPPGRPLDRGRRGHAGRTSRALAPARRSAARVSTA